MAPADLRCRNRLAVRTVATIIMKRVGPLTDYRVKTRGVEFDMQVPPDAPEVAPGFALPTGVRCYSKAMVLPPNLKLEDWEKIGATINKTSESLAWWWGDWWRFGDHKYGERATAVAKGITNHTFKTLMTYGWVAAKIPTSRRLEVLSFSHHQAVAPLPSAEQDKWLAKAVRFKWSVKKLEQSIYHHDQRNQTDEERARAWAWRATQLAKDQYWNALHCTIDEKTAKLLEGHTIAELADATKSAAVFWAEAAKANAAFRNKHKPNKAKPSRRGKPNGQGAGLVV